MRDSVVVIFHEVPVFQTLAAGLVEAALSARERLLHVGARRRLFPPWLLKADSSSDWYDSQGIIAHQLLPERDSLGSGCGASLVP